MLTFAAQAQQAAPKATGLPKEIRNGSPYRQNTDLKQFVMNDALSHSKQQQDYISQLVDNPQWLPQLTSPEARELWAVSLTRKNGMIKSKYSREATQDRAIEVENAYRQEQAKKLADRSVLANLRK